jgi:hypothetical protein
MWEPRRLTILWASAAFNRDIFTFFFYLYRCFHIKTWRWKISRNVMFVMSPTCSEDHQMILFKLWKSLLQQNQNSAAPCLKPLLLTTIITSSLPYCPYQKDEWPKRGDFLQKHSPPPKIKCHLNSLTTFALSYFLPFLLVSLSPGHDPLNPEISFTLGPISAATWYVAGSSRQLLEIPQERKLGIYGKFCVIHSLRFLC